MPLIRCLNLEHPGRHLATPKCVSPKRDGIGARVGAWLEGALNPKRGDPGRETCASCGNALIEYRGRCTYCEARRDR